MGDRGGGIGVVSRAGAMGGSGVGRGRGKRAQVSVQLWEDASTISRFKGIVENMRSQSEDILGFPPVEVTARYLSTLAGSLTVFQEKVLGRDSPVEQRRMTKLPHRMFSDFERNGSLECLLSTCLRFKATHGLRRLDLKNLDKKSLFLDMLKMCEKNLRNKQFLPIFKIYLSDGFSDARVEELRKIILKRAVVVKKQNEATHVVYETPRGCSASETEGTDYCRTLENQETISLVHWWYYPDSYDQWIPADDVQGEPEDVEDHKGPWHVGARFLEDTDLFNEWMNENDYEIAPEDREQFTHSPKAHRARERSSRKRRRDERVNIVEQVEEIAGKKRQRTLSDREVEEKGKEREREKERERKKEERRIRDREKRMREKEKARKKKEKDRLRQIERKRKRELEKQIERERQKEEWKMEEGEIVSKEEKGKEKEIIALDEKARRGEREGELKRKKVQEETKLEDGRAGTLKIRLSFHGKEDAKGREKERADGDADKGEGKGGRRDYERKRKRAESPDEEGKGTVGGVSDAEGEFTAGDVKRKSGDEATPIASAEEQDLVDGEEKTKGRDKEELVRDPDSVRRKKKKDRRDRKRSKKKQIGVTFVENAAPLDENDVPRIRNLSMEVEEDRKGQEASSSDPAKGRSKEKECQSAAEMDSTTADKAHKAGKAEEEESVRGAGGSARIKAVTETALQGKDAGMPATVADLVDALPETPVRIPAQARWFRFESIHDVEKRALTEFFSGGYPSKTPKIYKVYRDFMIHAWRNAPDKYLTATAVRRQLAGDVCAILRVHSFLEHWGLINYGVSPQLRPAAMPLARTHAWRTTPVAVSDVNSKTTAVPRILFFDESQPRRKSAVPVSLKQAIEDTKKLPPGQVPLASRREIYAAAAATTYACNSCGDDCSKTRYHSVGGADIDLCPQCFADGKYPQMLAARDFEQLTVNPQTDDSENPTWSETETLLLLEALERFDDDWKAVAKHVGTKTKEECVLQFLRLPIEDSFLGDQLGKWGKGNGVRQFEGQLFPFADAGNPVMAQVAFLASSVSPEVAAAAAQSALNVLMGGTIPEEVERERERLAGTVMNGCLPEHVINNLPERESKPDVEMQDSTLQPNTPNRTSSPSREVRPTPKGDVQMANGAHPEADVSGKDNQLDALTSQAPMKVPSAVGSKAGNDVVQRRGTNLQLNSESELEGAQNRHAMPNGQPEATKADQAQPEAPTPSRAANAVHMDRMVVEASAAVALAAAAARARKLADAEAREIERQFAIILETKLRAMEVKMKHFEDFESHLRAERDRLEKQRRQMYSERMAAALAKRKLKQSADVEGGRANTLGVQNVPFGEPTFSLGPLQLPKNQPKVVLPGITAPGGRPDAPIARVAGAEGRPVGSPPPKSSPEPSTDVSRQGSLEPATLGTNSGKLSPDILPS